MHLKYALNKSKVGDKEILIHFQTLIILTYINKKNVPFAKLKWNKSRIFVFLFLV